MTHKMYGYRQAHDNHLMTNLNSISSSVSSIDTIGRGPNHNKASVDNLITLRSHSLASTSLLWKNNKENDRYTNKTGTLTSTRHRPPGSEIYYNGGRTLTCYCLNSRTALNLLLVPLLLLTILRQVFDFLGQIWLQIIINFFTILLLIVALFGVKQHRISYLSLFSLWALLNTIWNLIVICIHFRVRDIPLNEDVLSLYTGATSWWHSNGPGCLPYNISSIQQSITIQPNIITGCRWDYHLIESTQAAIHAVLSFLASLICCCLIATIHKYPPLVLKANGKSDKQYQLNNLMHDLSKVNQDPSPHHMSSRFITNSASLRRATNKTSSRSSQHSVASTRSARRRHRQAVDENLPSQRGSTSSAQRSQKYGSLSSRRSGKRERRGDGGSSVTYGTTGERAGTSQRTRLSSLSSVDYLPSYQPPHSSSANLLSSYGEISSIDSYNNRSSRRGTKNAPTSVKTIKGNTNPTYNGSRSSICSQNNNGHNYDDLSYIYGNNIANNSESLYGVSNQAMTNGTRQQRQNNYIQNKQGNSVSRRNEFRTLEHSAGVPQRIHAETHQAKHQRDYVNGDTITRAKSSNGGTFNSFSVPNYQAMRNRNQASVENGHPEVNNNHLTNGNGHSDVIQDRADRSVYGHYSAKDSNSFDGGSRNIDNSKVMGQSENQQNIYSNQSYSRHPMYSNTGNGNNSETPI